MPLTFYPHYEDVQKGSLEDRLEALMEAAERYKAVVLDMGMAKSAVPEPDATTPAVARRAVPRDLTVSYNWEEIALVLRTIRDLPEISKMDKVKKGTLLSKLAEVYEVLRAAKMAKLEAVRLALISEANHLGLSGNETQVA